MSHMSDEIASQPTMWATAIERTGEFAAALPRHGERLAVLGCGTSWHVASSYASLRESRGHGETDCFATSEFPLDRRYDRVLLLSRSGTTSEVLNALEQLRGTVPTVAITADPASPIVDLADELVVLDFADERSVVQTRFATTTLALLRHHLGQDLHGVLADGERALQSELPEGILDASQITLLGTGWSYGLAQEGALKLRETAGFWAEAYPNQEYRHGPISIAAPGRWTWLLGGNDPALVTDVRRTGATVLVAEFDPLAELIRVQRVAHGIAEQRSMDPDQPQHLSRSVILPAL